MLIFPYIIKRITDIKFYRKIHIFGQIVLMAFFDIFKISSPLLFLLDQFICFPKKFVGFSVSADETMQIPCIITNRIGIRKNLV